MTLTTHATIGALIGAATGNPFLAFGAGLLSHFLVDIIPHGDRELYENHKRKQKHRRAYAFVTIDGIVAVMVIALMTGFQPVQYLNASIAMGVIGSILPDLIIGIHEAFHIKWLRWFHRLHFFFHNMISNRWGDVPLRYALFAQAVFVIVAQRWF
ncbi:hypothetical protein A3C17_02970 [Candidatus Uhrbacteria bacterium RIFCSPHIGHO2_02_FULL_53_13]|uniref:Uncharacterized protein n=2 Tax=Candidatus Uhriibacteriota TaxID=1752732 RepID=A0A1F7U0E6_9BACT|nr:MAG: hypothetical protein A3C17_02970 [Candidatus Uhrbacteria bacterium RIFCSPHIGHO2_02_FULL_53_13]OGL89078.1 MAG: hypothetical protein A3I45_02255 [Candidatus Uhrbacteria bacterium RIFCSPLOWO2_02_FULL_53_10]